MRYVHSCNTAAAEGSINVEDSIPASRSVAARYVRNTIIRRTYATCNCTHVSGADCHIIHIWTWNHTLAILQVRSVREGYKCDIRMIQQRHVYRKHSIALDLSSCWYSCSTRLYKHRSPTAVSGSTTNHYQVYNTFPGTTECLSLIHI